MGRVAVVKFVYCNVIALTFLLAIITLAGAYADRVSPARSSIMPFIGLGLTFLLLTNLLFAVYWIVRLRIWFIVPLLAIAGNYHYLGRIFRFPSSEVPPVVNILKIATFNADSFGKEWMPYSTRDLAAYLKKENVDIICFQEFGSGLGSFPIKSVCDVFKDWNYYYLPVSPDSTNYLQLAVFSKYPIKDSTFYPFQQTANCSMYCDIDINGSMLRLFDLHLQTTSASSNMRKIKKNSPFDIVGNTLESVGEMMHDMSYCFVARSEQADFVRKKIDQSPYPVIVCGDFNSLPSSYTYRTILGNDLVDGFCQAGHGYMYTFRYVKHLLRIDYIFASKKFNIVDYNSPQNDFHSDHNPVIMTMKL